MRPEDHERRRPRHLRQQAAEERKAKVMPSNKVMHKFKKGQLHSGSKKGPVVKNRKRAIAIMKSEERAEKKAGGKYPEKGSAKAREKRLEGKEL